RRAATHILEAASESGFPAARLKQGKIPRRRGSRRGASSALKKPVGKEPHRRPYRNELHEICLTVRRVVELSAKHRTSGHGRPCQRVRHARSANIAEGHFALGRQIHGAGKVDGYKDQSCQQRSEGFCWLLGNAGIV